MNSLQESSWLAGLLEGEASFDTREDHRGENRRPKLRVSVQMTDRDVVERAIAIMPLGGRAGIQTVDVAKQTKIPWRKTAYRAEWTGQKAENLMRRVHSYMGARRKSKITECLNVPNMDHHTRLVAA
jgi:hypothetical protein